MRRWCMTLAVLTICGTISSLTAQEKTTVEPPSDLTVGTSVVLDDERSTPDTVVSPVSSTPADDHAAVAFGQVVGQPAPAPPTPQHTGIKAMLGELVGDVKHLPSKENLFGRASAEDWLWRPIQRTRR